MVFRASEVATWCEGRLDGPDRELAGLEAMDRATSNHLTFVANKRFGRQLIESKAAGAICTNGLDLRRRPEQIVIWVADADIATIKVLEQLAVLPQIPDIGVHPTAVIDPSAILEEGVRIGPHVVVQAGATIGKRSVLMAGIFVGAGSTLGADCFLAPNVTIYENCAIGSRVAIHSGCVIGADGFGYHFTKGHFEKIPHIGSVVINDDCEIGANTTVDRGKYSATTIGQGSKLDNHVQVAHNVLLGKHCILVAHTAIGGSTQCGDYLMMGGCSAIKDHVVLGNRVQVAAMAAVVGDQPDGATLVGIPAINSREYASMHRATHQLPRLLQTVHDLEQRIALLERAAKDHLA